MDGETRIAAEWCRKHQVPPLPPEWRESLQEPVGVIHQRVQDEPDIPPAEVRVYYQSLQYILRTAARRQALPPVAKRPYKPTTKHR